MLGQQLSLRIGFLTLTAPFLVTYASVIQSEQIAARQCTRQTSGRWIWLEAFSKSVLVVNSKTAIWESKLFCLHTTYQYNLIILFSNKSHFCYQPINMFSHPHISHDVLLTCDAFHIHIQILTIPQGLFKSHFLQEDFIRPCNYKLIIVLQISCLKTILVFPSNSNTSKLYLFIT